MPYSEPIRIILRLSGIALLGVGLTVLRVMWGIGLLSESSVTFTLTIVATVLPIVAGVLVYHEARRRSSDSLVGHVLKDGTSSNMPAIDEKI